MSFLLIILGHHCYYYIYFYRDLYYLHKKNVMGLSQNLPFSKVRLIFKVNFNALKMQNDDLRCLVIFCVVFIRCLLFSYVLINIIQFKKKLQNFNSAVTNMLIYF